MNSRNSLFKKVILAALIIFVIWFVAGRLIGDKSKIRKVLDTAVHAAENEDKMEFLSVFSSNYEDDTGFTKFLIMQFCQRAFNQFEDIDVDLSNVNIEVEGKKATVKLRIWGEATRASTMGEGKNPVRESFEQAGAIITLVKEGGDWKIASSQRIAFASKVIF